MIEPIGYILQDRTYIIIISPWCQKIITLGSDQMKLFLNMRLGLNYSVEQARPE
jgi:hypothetical protein